MTLGRQPAQDERERALSRHRELPDHGARDDAVLAQQETVSGFVRSVIMSRAAGVMRTKARLALSRRVSHCVRVCSFADRFLVRLCVVCVC